MIVKREHLEEMERQFLAPYALKSADSAGRVNPDSESDTRTAFQRDRDRIIHTRAFRRLEYKTQVFIFYEGDHYRTRLTHTIEVAQLGMAIARGLGVNQDLTEAICLAHDLGHSPFGHAGEWALDALMKDHGGFNHNVQSYRVVTELEKRYENYPGLNLSYETREGIIKHETDYDHTGEHKYAPGRRASLEAQIANLADEAAYNAHDLDDGLRAGFFNLEELDQLAIWQRLRKNTGWESGPFTEMIRHAMIRELVGFSVGNIVTTTDKRLSTAGIDSPEGVQLHDTNIVGYADSIHAEIKELKAFLLQNMYRHYRLMRMTRKAERFIGDIFNAYIAEPAMLPTKTQIELENNSKERVICDYIAGMTDRYALDEWERLLMPYASP
ncbi:MAG: deoxyguanosinetriphosphate triphosphohydrolase [Chloroflexota bacterium]